MKRTSVLVNVCALIGLMTLLSGCGIFHPDDFPADGPSFKATANPMTVTKRDLGHNWPFDTVSEVSVSCKHDGDDVALTVLFPDGTTYSLNGVKANENLKPADDVASRSVGPLRSIAFDTCDVENK